NESDNAPNVLIADVTGESGHLRSRHAVRDGAEQVGVFIAYRIDSARQIRPAPPLSADAVARRTVGAERGAATRGGLGIADQGVLRLLSEANPGHENRNNHRGQHPTRITAGAPGVKRAGIV